MSGLTDLAAWQTLSDQARRFTKEQFQLRQLFDEPQRFQDFSLKQGNLLLDYSKNYLDQASLDALLALAEARELPAAIDAMFRGDAINNTEQRPALHVALREPAESSSHPEVEAALEKMAQFIAAVHSQQWRGFSSKPIKAVVNIGIGGSDLGPAMVTQALKAYASGHVAVHFVSNVDPVHLRQTLATLDPETTLFIVASKSFTTLETHQNAAAARRWFLQCAGDEAAIAKHFVAISTNREAATAFGIDPDNLFPMWDWVGGRYSLWSAIGLPVALAIGMDHFRALLAGAHAMDRHFRSAELRQNMPVLMGLLTVWYTGFFNAHSSAVVPYCQPLEQFPSFLQQLYMESLGKRVDRAGNPVESNTGEVLWGTVGTNGQHSYFQLFHQGREFIPVDFIATSRAGVDEAGEAHRHLLSNCLSQSLALMQGTPDEQDPHKQVPGNKPSNTLLLDELNPHNLGSLIALYEHKVYVQSVIWGINAFDQWGVELGKQLSKSLFSALGNDKDSAGLDSSSAGLIQQIKQWDTP